MPFLGTRRLAAIASRSSLGLECLAISSSSERLKTASSLAFSTLARASFKLSSTERPRIKLPRVVALAME